MSRLQARFLGSQQDTGQAPRARPGISSALQPQLWGYTKLWVLSNTRTSQLLCPWWGPGVLSSCQEVAEHREGMFTAAPALLCVLHTHPQALSSPSLRECHQAVRQQHHPVHVVAPGRSGHCVDDNTRVQGPGSCTANPGQGAA